MFYLILILWIIGSSQHTLSVCIVDGFECDFQTIYDKHEFSIFSWKLKLKEAIYSSNNLWTDKSQFYACIIFIEIKPCQDMYLCIRLLNQCSDFTLYSLLTRCWWNDKNVAPLNHIVINWRWNDESLEIVKPFIW